MQQLLDLAAAPLGGRGSRKIDMMDVLDHFPGGTRSWALGGRNMAGGD
jgi:hypothetical protein